MAGANPEEGNFRKASQPERIASLETTAKFAKWVLGIFIPIVIGWGAFISMNVIAMKQQLADGGNTKLVTELKAPKSPEQLQANLTTVTAQIQTARVNGVKPNPQKVAALSEALSQVIQKGPDVPEAWQAATTLVTYRSPQSVSSKKMCFGNSSDFYLNNYNSGTRMTDHISEMDCTVVLSDVKDFENSAAGKNVKNKSRRYSSLSSSYPTDKEGVLYFV